MKIILPVGIALTALYFLFRSEPVEREAARSAEVVQAVNNPEQAARTNFVKSPIDRTKAAMDQVRESRSVE